MRNGLQSVISLPESGFVPRGPTAFDIFRGGVSPVETVLGESHVLTCRIERSPIFSRVEIKRMSLRENLGIRKRLPRFPIQVHSAIVQFQMQQSAGFVSKGALDGEKITPC